MSTNKFEKNILEALERGDQKTVDTMLEGIAKVNENGEVITKGARHIEEKNRTRVMTEALAYEARNHSKYPGHNV